MVSNRMALFLFCIVGVAMLVFAAEEGELSTVSCDSTVKKMQKEMYYRMSTVSHRSLELYPKYKGLNVQFFPLIDSISTNMAWVFSYYWNNLGPLQSKDEFMEEPFKAAGELLEFQEKSNNFYIFKLDTKMLFAVVGPHSIEYFLDLFNNFRFVENNYGDVNTTISNINKKYISGRNFLNESLVVPGRSIYHITYMLFEACWARPTGTHDISFDIGYIEIPEWAGRVMNPTTVKNVSAFYSMERYSYFNDPNGKYEALRIPFDREEFAFVILLPAVGISLESFKNYSGDDYLRVINNFSSASAKRKSFLIPNIHLPTISITERGVKINNLDKNPSKCDDRNRKVKPFAISCNSYDPNCTVLVDRPFLAMIYNEENKFPLWMGWIFDPFSKEIFTPKDDPKLLGGVFIS